MPRPLRTPFLLVAAIAAGLALAGCGRKGKLEPPPGQDYVTDANGKQKDPGPLKPHRALPLDFLLN